MGEWRQDCLKGVSHQPMAAPTAMWCNRDRLPHICCCSGANDPKNVLATRVHWTGLKVIWVNPESQVQIWAWFTVRVTMATLVTKFLTRGCEDLTSGIMSARRGRGNGRVPKVDVLMISEDILMTFSLKFWIGSFFISEIKIKLSKHNCFDQSFRVHVLEVDKLNWSVELWSMSTDLVWIGGNHYKGAIVLPWLMFRIHEWTFHILNLVSANTCYSVPTMKSLPQIRHMGRWKVNHNRNI